jgi:cell division protein FtsQ
MPRKPVQESVVSTAARNAASVVRTAVGIGLLLTGLAGAVFAFTRVEQFFVSDHRLALPALPEGASSGPNFRVYGLNHGPEERVAEVFARDFQRSLYLCPIAERRDQLIKDIDWIKEASVARVWPNSLVIRIQERIPVAFAHIGGSAPRIALVDAEGILMTPGRNLNDFDLPVLTGIDSSDKLNRRKERVDRYLGLKKELSGEMQKISEIDVSDTENIMVTEQFDDRAYTFMLGNKDYLKRLTNFTSNYQEIKKRMPEDPAILDLRMEDRIIFVPVRGGKPNGK